MVMDIEKEKRILERVLSHICFADTFQSRGAWDPHNPFWGHCAVVTLLAQDILGREILSASLEGTGWSGNHYLNFLLDGEEVDFTKGQFGDNAPNLRGLAME
jgi:hypothetical protein